MPNANANSFSDESGSDEDSVDSYAGAGRGYGRGRRSFGEGGSTEDKHAPAPPRSVYRNSLRLSRKWVRKSVSAGRLLPPPHFVALATSPCGCMFAAACKGSDEVTLWLRRRNMATQGKPWENSQYGSSQMHGYPMAQYQQRAAGGAGSGGQGEGPWTFQPATVLATGGPLAQVVWGRGPGAQRDYLLTLGEDGRCPRRKYWLINCLLVSGLDGRTCCVLLLACRGDGCCGGCVCGMVLLRILPLILKTRISIVILLLEMSVSHNVYLVFLMIMCASILLLLILDSFFFLICGANTLPYCFEGTLVTDVFCIRSYT